MFEDASQKDVKVIHKFLDPILHSAATQHAAYSSKSDQSTLLSHLVSETEDPALLRDELLNILVADNIQRLIMIQISLLQVTPQLVTQ